MTNEIETLIQTANKLHSLVTDMEMDGVEIPAALMETVISLGKARDEYLTSVYVAAGLHPIAN